MKKYILIFFILISSNTYSQKVTNLIFVGPEGVTEDFSKALSFIVVKQFPEYFERLDYKKSGPLMKVRQYRDAELSSLEGKYYEYREDGRILYSGNYSKNQKNGDWNTYNDTGKVIHSVRYENNVIAETYDLDKKDSSITYADEREAAFPGGDKAWMKYLVKSLEKKETADKAINGGQVIANFAVTNDGKLTDVFLSKSVEYALDEDTIEIILKSPNWIPAWQNGHGVNAYRKQPLTYARNN